MISAVCYPHLFRASFLRASLQRRGRRFSSRSLMLRWYAWRRGRHQRPGEPGGEGGTPFLRLAAVLAALAAACAVLAGLPGLSGDWRILPLPASLLAILAGAAMALSLGLALWQQPRIPASLALVQARRDPLTGLASRSWLSDRLRRLLTAPHGPESGCLVHLNIRGFKDVNSTFGYAAGDYVLRTVAERLRLFAGHGQRGTGDVVARLGGDDFALLLPGLAEPHHVSGRLFEIETAIRVPVRWQMIDIDPRPVIGVACFPRHGLSAEEILSRADLAMQSIRNSETASISFYTPEMEQDVQRRKAIRVDLRQGIENGHLHLLYQPKIDLHTGQVSGMEALVRWNHPQRGRISPVEFIPVAERSGLIVPLGQWVLEESCRQARQWLDHGLGALRVSVNMSPVQLLRHDVVGSVRQVLERSGLPADLLEIEITEGVFMQGEGKALQRLRCLREMGVRLAIDDFGTGYSSLNYLKTLPVTCLKIDQSFVRNLHVSEEDARLSRVIIGMAHDFGLEVVAEGIETARHARFLAAEGCDFGQGYYYAKPLEVEEFEQMVGKGDAFALSPMLAEDAFPPAGSQGTVPEDAFALT